MSKAALRLVKQASWREIRHVDTSDTTHIVVKGLSRTAVSGDLRRLCVKAGLENIANVSISYRRFVPTQEGFISFTHASFVQNALKTLRNSIVGGYPITVAPSPFPGNPHLYRTRGQRGRADAAQRGVLTGDGPSGGVTHPGKNVVIYGLPPRVTAQTMKRFLHDFMLADSGKTGEQEIVKLESWDKNPITSRYLIRLANASDAHRLARQLHMSMFSKETWGARYRVKARVIA